MANSQRYMAPDDAAQAILAVLGLPNGAANVLVWHDSEQPSLRVWVEERYLWQVKQIAPALFEGYRVDVEKRPVITAHSLNDC